MYLSKINKRVDELETLVFSLIRENKELKYLGKEVKAGEIQFTVKAVRINKQGETTLLGGEFDNKDSIGGYTVRYKSYAISINESRCELINEKKQ